jgi:hypothetical protein
MTPRKPKPSLTDLLQGGALPPKVTRTLRSEEARNLIRLPPKMAEHFQAQGRNLFPAKPHGSVTGLQAARGAYALTVEDLPEESREEMIREARQNGYRVREDHTLELGDCVLFTQYESERAELEAEEREQMAIQLDGQVEMSEALNQALAQEFGARALLGAQLSAKDGELKTIINQER